MKAFKLRQAHTTMPPGHATCVCRVAWGTVDGMFTLGEHRTKYCYQGVSCNNSFLVDTNHHFHFRVLRRLIFGSVFVSRPASRAQTFSRQDPVKPYDRKRNHYYIMVHALDHLRS